MIIWVNGAFGAGKTHTAYELERRHGAAHIADPELIGFGVNRMLPPTARGDFQDRPQWRRAVADTLADADAGFDGPIIVPMTIVDPLYFDEIVGDLRRRGHDVRHYALIAAPETLHHRLSTRGGPLTRLVGSDEGWARAQIDRCTAALASEVFGTHIDTDELTLDEVVETIAADSGLDLAHGRLSRAAATLRQALVAARHIR